MRLCGKKILVTGAGGFLGSHLTERLVSEGANVRALVRYNARGSAGWLDTSQVLDDIELVAGDVCDPAACQAAVEGCDIVYHLAALTTVPYSYLVPESFVRNNIDGTLAMLEAVRRADKAERFIQASSSQTYGTAQTVPIREDHPLEAQSPYAATKIACDALVAAWGHSYGVPGIILKVFCTYGPRQSVRNIIPTIITQLLHGPRVRLGNLGPRRDYNFVDDAIEAYVLAGTAPDIVHSSMNICGNAEISIAELAETIARLMGSDLEIVQDPARMRPVTSEVDRLLGDSSAAQNMLGWRHSVGLETGLRQTIDWYRTNMALVMPVKSEVFR